MKRENDVVMISCSSAVGFLTATEAAASGQQVCSGPSAAQRGCFAERPPRFIFVLHTGNAFASFI